MTTHGTTDSPTEQGWRRRWLGLVICIVPAAFLAACSLASGDDSVATEDADSIPPASTTVDATTATTASSTPANGENAATTTVELGSAASDSADSDTGSISFATDIEPIIVSTCANCHTGTGPGTQHVIMDTAGVVAKASVGIEFVTRTGFMPPWPASDESVPFDHDWSLSPEETALLAEWHEAGAPLDVPDDHAIAPIPGESVRLEDPDLEVRSQGSYDGELGQDDEYRCMIYDPDFDGAGYVTGMDFLPDQEQVVHHAVGFLVSGDDRAQLEALDGVDGNGGGWTCFGFTPAASADLVYAWAPGQSASRYPTDSGLYLDDGDFFVVQTHYHFDVEAPADQSTLALDWTPIEDGAGIDGVDVSLFLGPAEIPCQTGETGPLCDRDAAVALAKEKYGVAGFFADAILSSCGQTPEDYADFTDGYAESTCDQRANVRGELISVFGHEHEVGASFRMTINPDTPDEIVLLDIPDWDFDWQLNYEPIETIVLERDDVIRMECSWDLARRDPALEPAYIVWSDGTDDEMCFASIVTRPL